MLSVDQLILFLNGWSSYLQKQAQKQANTDAADEDAKLRRQVSYSFEIHYLKFTCFMGFAMPFLEDNCVGDLDTAWCKYSIQ